MRRIIKGLVNRTWKPFVEWYLRRPRIYKYKGISITILPEVFHPGIFFSTKLLISFLDQMVLKGKKLLEMGSGAGLISIVAAKKEAIVTASDISPLAVSCTKENVKRNEVNVSVFESDLFNSIPVQTFDFIVVNPPYYKKAPTSMAQQAWYCGENLEYFHKFFQQAISFTNNNSQVLMVLSDECDLDGIQAIAEKYHWKWELVLEKRTAWEKGFIFNIRPMKDEML